MAKSDWLLSMDSSSSDSDALFSLKGKAVEFLRDILDLRPEMDGSEGWWDENGTPDRMGDWWTDEPDGWDMKGTLVGMGGQWTDKMDGYIEWWDRFWAGTDVKTGLDQLGVWRMGWVGWSGCGDLLPNISLMSELLTLKWDESGVGTGGLESWLWWLIILPWLRKSVCLGAVSSELSLSAFINKCSREVSKAYQWVF